MTTPDRHRTGHFLSFVHWYEAGSGRCNLYVSGRDAAKTAAATPAFAALRWVLLLPEASTKSKSHTRYRHYSFVAAYYRFAVDRFRSDVLRHQAQILQ
jgi:hypothetical protein